MSRESKQHNVAINIVVASNYNNQSSTQNGTIIVPTSSVGGGGEVIMLAIIEDVHRQSAENIKCPIHGTIRRISVCLIVVVLWLRMVGDDNATI